MSEADHEAQANAEIVGDVRRLANEVTGGNCSFADDDIKVLAVLAKWAILNGCPDDIAPNILPKARHHLNGAKG